MQRKDRPRGEVAQGPRKTPPAETKKLLAIFEPALRAAIDVMDVGAEAILFAPDGRLFLVRRETEATFRARPLEDVSAATDCVLRWRAEERAAEAVT